MPDSDVLLYLALREAAHQRLFAGVVGDRADQVVAQPRHAGEEPLVGGLTQREVEQHVAVGHVEALGEAARRWPAPARPCPGAPSGRPMSEAVSTSPASAPRPGADLLGEHRADRLAEHRR